MWTKQPYKVEVGREGVRLTSHLGLSRLLSLILCSLPSCRWTGLCVNHHPLQKGASSIRLDWRSGYSSESLAVSVILCSVSRVTVTGSPLGPGCLLTDSCPQWQDVVSSCGVGLTSNQKGIANSNDIHASIVPVGLSCQVSCYCSPQDT